MNEYTYNRDTVRKNVTMKRVRVRIISVEMCVFVTLVIQNTKRMSHIVICGLSRSTIFFHIIAQRHNFRKKES